MLRARPARAASTVDQDGPVTVARRHRRRTGARGFAKAAGLLARVIHVLVSIVVLIIVAGILLVVLKANPANSIVSEVHDGARSLAAPFDGIFRFQNAHVVIAVNWGIAAVVYLLVGGLIGRLIARANR